MKVYKSLKEVGDPEGGAVVAFGVFDGVHIGHTRIISRCVEEARRRSARSVVITFKRHPREILRHSPPDFLMTLRHRLKHIEMLGVQECLLLDFDKQIADTRPEAFIRQFVAVPFNAVTVVVGFDQRFGHKGGGDARLVKKLADEYGYDAITVEKVTYAGARVSSSRIRQCISDGDLQMAAKMLGRCYAIEGSITRCETSRIGTFATFDAHHEAQPMEGRYEGELLTSKGNIPVGAHMPVKGEDIELFIPGASYELSSEKRILLKLRKRL